MSEESTAIEPTVLYNASELGVDDAVAHGDGATHSEHSSDEGAGASEDVGLDHAPTEYTEDVRSDASYDEHSQYYDDDDEEEEEEEAGGPHSEDSQLSEYTDVPAAAGVGGHARANDDGYSVSTSQRDDQSVLFASEAPSETSVGTSRPSPSAMTPSMYGSQTSDAGEPASPVPQAQEIKDMLQAHIDGKAAEPYVMDIKPVRLHLMEPTSRAELTSTGIGLQLHANHFCKTNPESKKHYHPAGPLRSVQAISGKITHVTKPSDMALGLRVQGFANNMIGPDGVAYAAVIPASHTSGPVDQAVGQLQPVDADQNPALNKVIAHTPEDVDMLNKEYKPIRSGKRAGLVRLELQHPVVRAMGAKSARAAAQLANEKQLGAKHIDVSHEAYRKLRREVMLDTMSAPSLDALKVSMRGIPTGLRAGRKARKAAQKAAEQAAQRAAQAEKQRRRAERERQRQQQMQAMGFSVSGAADGSVDAALSAAPIAGAEAFESEESTEDEDFAAVPQQASVGGRTSGQHAPANNDEDDDDDSDEVAHVVELQGVFHYVPALSHAHAQAAVDGSTPQ